MGQSFLNNFIAHLAKRIEEDSNKSEETWMPTFILTIWRESQLADGWEDSLANFDAVSIKIMDGVKPYDHKGVESMVSKLEGSPIDVHGWGYHYCQEPARARDEAIAVAIRCEELGITHYHWNAERHWKEGVGTPSDNAIVFAEELKKLAPGVMLYANCFVSLTTKEMAKHFNYFEPMCYGTKRKTIASKVGKRMSGKPFPAVRTGIMVGTGRVNSKVSGQYWGYVSPPGKEKEPLGLAQLVKVHSPCFVNFFRAGRIDGQDMGMDGNEVNPKLSDQVGLVLDHLGQAQV